MRLEAVAAAAPVDFPPASLHIALVKSIPFDTLRLSRSLREKGHFSAEQEEAVAGALGEAAQGDLATKADLANLEARFKAGLAELKADILKWIAEAIGFQPVVILGALISLVRIFAK